MATVSNRVKVALLVTAAGLSLQACATKDLKEVRKGSAMRSTTVESQLGKDFDAARPAIRRVRLSGDFFALKPQGGELPQSIADANVRIDFGGQVPTFDDLILLLEDRGLPVILGWDDGGFGVAQAAAPDIVKEPEQAGVVKAVSRKAPSDIRSRPLPFRRYTGTLGGLFKQLQRSMGVTIWWNDGIYVSPVGRYSVMLPQNKDLMGQVAKELEAKGATNVVTSIQAGTVSFVAPGALADEVIRPYLIRLGRNASEVTMQVALVSVVMNEEASRGFDWSQFNLNFGTPAETVTSVTSGIGGAVTDTGGTGASNLPKGDLFSFGPDSTRFFDKGMKILGSTRPLDITGAIKFLSTYGKTAVDQNVELRTLAGTAVNWRSGETIPYVSGVSATQGGLVNGGSSYSGLNGAIGAAQTEELETGLTLELAPNYEAAGGLVTVSFKLELKELIEMVELNAGNQLGSFTQPRTREQKLDDIVRIPIGETVVLGGLRRQLASAEKNGPLGLYALGSKGRQKETQTVFIVLRPSVTVYEVEGLMQPIPSGRSEISVDAHGKPWAPAKGEYRGTNMFGASIDGTAPVRKRSMAQPEKSYED